MVGRALLLKGRTLFRRGQLDQALAPLDQGIDLLSALSGIAQGQLESPLSDARTLRTHIRAKLGLPA
jgi:hypothetical protein